ncbi:hypothetical protein PAMP_000201 [Pampus punctatissimus]
MRERQKGASRKESEKAEGFRCSGAADMQKGQRQINIHASERRRGSRLVGLRSDTNIKSSLAFSQSATQGILS